MSDLSEKKHIFLTGFMGTGKSSVGSVVAERLGRDFVDLDARIVAGAGMPVTEIFRVKGERAFRELEHEALERLGTAAGLVVATGGGIVLRDDNRLLMHRDGLIVNLTATADAIFERVLHDEGRPLLQGRKSQDGIIAMLAEREPFYADADLRIDTTGRSVEEVGRLILVWLNNHPGSGVQESWIR